MNLTKINERVWISDFDEVRDRPSLGIIIGDKFNLAIDAGHSYNHVHEFYEALNYHDIDLPTLTILTHYHWDHSFGLHAINGLSISERRTYNQLNKIINENALVDELMATNECFSLEFENQEVVITNTDLVYDNEIDIDLGGIKVKALHIPSPHTDDSTVIYLPNDKIIFLGDCISGVYPDWIKDKKMNELLKESLNKIDFDLAIGSHWLPFDKDDLMKNVIDAI